jgi:hypothetical protein
MFAVKTMARSAGVPPPSRTAKAIATDDSAVPSSEQA